MGTSWLVSHHVDIDITRCSYTTPFLWWYGAWITFKNPYQNPCYLTQIFNLGIWLADGTIIRQSGDHFTKMWATSESKLTFSFSLHLEGISGHFRQINIKLIWKVRLNYDWPQNSAFTSHRPCNIEKYQKWNLFTKKWAHFKATSLVKLVQFVKSVPQSTIILCDIELTF